MDVLNQFSFEESQINCSIKKDVDLNQAYNPLKIFSKKFRSRYCSKTSLTQNMF